MIYFIESALFNFREGSVKDSLDYIDNNDLEFSCIYKIGYAKDSRWKIRNNSYKTENPGRYVHKTIQGATLEDEISLHYYLSNNFSKYKNSKEWYIKSRELYDYMMNLTLEDIQNLPRYCGSSRRADYYKELEPLVRYFWDRDPMDITSYSISSKKFFDSIIEDLGSGISDEEILNGYLLDTFGEERYNKYLDRDNELERLKSNLSEKDCKDFDEFMEEYYSKTTYYDKMKMLCNTSISKESLGVVLDQIPDNDDIKSHYLALGRERCKSLGYMAIDIKAELNFKVSDGSISEEVYKIFKSGDRRLRSDIKIVLADIYSRLGLKKKAKAIDLENYFELKECFISVFNEKAGKKKQQLGYKILGKKKL